jgi:hypothetical protein
MAPRPRGLSGSGRQRINAALTLYSGTENIQDERRRQRENMARAEAKQMEEIPWGPGNNHGSNESSRVSGYKFVNYNSEDIDDEDRRTTGAGAIMSGQRYGTLFVRFWKYKDSGGTPWKYMNVPQQVYEAFAASPSKGQYINSVLNKFPYSRATGDEVSTYFTDI